MRILLKKGTAGDAARVSRAIIIIAAYKKFVYMCLLKTEKWIKSEALNPKSETNFKFEIQMF